MTKSHSIAEYWQSGFNSHMQENALIDVSRSKPYLNSVSLFLYNKGAEQIAEIEARAPRDEDIVYDEDCPPMTDEQLRQFKRVNPRPALAEPSEKFGTF